MTTAVFAVVVVAFAVVAFLLIRRTQRGAVVDRLPLEEGEQVLLAEEGARVFHRFRRTAQFGGGTVTARVRIVLTDRRIVVATGGPEGRHKFVLVMILDYTTPAPPVPETGYAAYLRKFRLEDGYPTYWFSAADVTFVDKRGATGVRIEVPFSERGPRWGDPPEVILFTSEPERYRELFGGRATSGPR